MNAQCAPEGTGAGTPKSARCRPLEVGLDAPERYDNEPRRVPPGKVGTVTPINAPRAPGRTGAVTQGSARCRSQGGDLKASKSYRCALVGDASAGTPELPTNEASVNNNYESADEESEHDYLSPEGLMSYEQFARHAKRCRRASDDENHCFVVYTRDVDPGNGYGPEHPAGARLFTEFKELFPEELPDGLPRSGRPEHAIPLKPDAKPVSRAMYRLSPKEREECQAFVSKAMKKGWIRPSCSPWGAPILFAAKKDGGLRFCVDYRWLNKQTVRDEYPLPRMDDLLDWSHGKRVFTSLDGHSGYHQIRIRTEDVPKTAFRTPGGSFEWRVMPFGLTNAPASFQALMNHVLREEINAGICVVYLDDIAIGSANEEQHERDVRRVLAKLRQHGIYLKAKKCEWFVPQMEFLGHRVSAQGLQVLPDKVKAIELWPVPTSVTEVRSFLGLASFYRRFIPAFAAVASPLTDLTKKDVPWGWDTRCEHAFNELKRLLSEAPVLASPDEEKPFTISTDASGEAIGAVLSQEGRPVAYVSRRLKPAERIKSAYERELMALAYAVAKWRCYVEGKRTRVETDHATLRHYQTQPTMSRQQARFVTQLAEQDLDIAYVKGKKNQVADALSRMPARGPMAEEFVDMDKLCAIDAVTLDKGFIKRFKQVGHEDPDYSRLMEEPGKQYKRVGDLLFRDLDGYLLLYVPNHEPLRRLILHEAHDSGAAGHLGRDRCYASLKRFFWWPGMKNDIESWLASCPKCQASKAPVGGTRGVPVPLPTPRGPWQDITMDLLTNLPKTKSKHDAILVFVDRYSKMIHLAPTSKQCTGEEAARLYLDHVYRMHGLLRSIVSDRDPRFTGKFWQQLFGLLGTKLRPSTAYHPQTDGQTERANRTIVQMLRTTLEDDTTWDEQLALVEHAYNSTVQASTGYTPFYLIYGRDVPSPITRLAEAVTQGATNPVVQQRMETWRRIHRKVVKRLAQAQKRMIRSLVPRRAPVRYQEGQQVLLKITDYERSDLPKLRKQWAGPFTVVQVVNPAAVKLALTGAYRRLHPVVHVSKIKPHVRDNAG